MRKINEIELKNQIIPPPSNEQRFFDHRISTGPQIRFLDEQTPVQNNIKISTGFGHCGRLLRGNGAKSFSEISTRSKWPQNEHQHAKKASFFGLTPRLIGRWGGSKLRCLFCFAVHHFSPAFQVRNWGAKSKWGIMWQNCFHMQRFASQSVVETYLRMFTMQWNGLIFFQCRCLDAARLADNEQARRKACFKPKKKQIKKKCHIEWSVVHKKAKTNR